MTRVLVVPSVWEEPFGRVAAEAMVNGIPPLVGEPRRPAATSSTGMPRAAAADWSVPIPDWMTPTGTRIPSEHEVEPWFGAVCALWDDALFYEAVRLEDGRSLMCDTAKKCRERSTWSTSPPSNRSQNRSRWTFPYPELGIYPRE